MREFDRSSRTVSGLGSGRGFRGAYKSNPSSEEKMTNSRNKRKQSQERSPTALLRQTTSGAVVTTEPDQLLTNEEDYQVFQQLFTTPKVPPGQSKLSIDRPSIMLIRKGPSAALSKEQFDELGDLSKTPLILGNNTASNVANLSHI